MMNKGIFNFNLIGEEAYNIYRVEQGIPASPNELNSECNPLEAGLIEYIDFNKGCYIGQEVIARLKNYDKIQRHLTGVRFNDKLVTNNGRFILNDNGIEVGIVTSHTYSYRLNATIGLAYIKSSYLKPYTQLSLKLSDGKETISEVHELPFVK
jgi:aminomethyltransferase